MFIRIVVLAAIVSIIGCTQINTREELRRDVVKQEDVMAFVVHEDNSQDSMEKEDIKRMYLNQRLYWANGLDVRFINHPDDTLEKNALNRRIIEQSATSIQRYWIKTVERGYYRPPIVIHSSKRIISMIARDREAISYVRLSEYEALRKKRRYKIKLVKIDGVEPSLENVKNGKYHFVIE